MAVVSVTPEEFTIVLFQADDIAALTEKIATKIGFPADTPISVRIDEPNLFQRVRLASMSPITLDIEGAALEDPKRFRQFSENLAENTLGRLLFQAFDRMKPEFAGAAEHDKLSNAHACAWDTYSAGRSERIGINVPKARHLYAFRNRHTFSDQSDAAFDRLWSATNLTWADITTASDGAAKS
jgi:hypothetical protein